MLACNYLSCIFKSHYPNLLNISSEFKILCQTGMSFRWTLSTLEKEQEMPMKN